MKPTEKELEIAKKIVNTLIRHNFFDAIVSIDSEKLWFWRKDHQDFLKEENLKVCSGETKACIISDELSNWVVKVGFVSTDESEDYCAIEAGNYKSAVKEGLEKFFATVYKLGSWVLPEVYGLKRNITFFIQEKAEPDEDLTAETCEEYMDCDEDYLEDLERVESVFGGLEKCKELNRLFEFIKKWNINDLHTGNFGYTGYGDVKIIDFSGY